MRWAGALSICVAVIASCAAISATAASRPRFVHCPSFTTHGLNVTKVRSNFGCRPARLALRNLLKGGVAGLPAKTRRAGKWGCKRSGKQRVCTRYRPRRHPARQVKFQAAVTTNGTPQPQPDPTPVPADLVQHCIDLWNAGGPTNSFGSTRLDGIHFYNDHHIREGWVRTIPNPAFPSVVRCEVVFAVPSDDPIPSEFGTDGEILTPDGAGWQIMSKDVAIQIQAPQHVNATLASDGTLQKKA
jgi:hypothetical protein